MTVSVVDLDAHEQPSEQMRAEWKAFSRLEQSLLQDSQVDDPRLPLEENGFRQAGALSQAQIAEAFAKLDPAFAGEATGDAPIIYHPLLPGLLVVPSLVPPRIQTSLLDTMIHRDLSNPTHQTNLHLHYDLPYPDPPPGTSSPSSSLSSAPDQQHPASFFSYAPDAPANFLPKDPSVHKPLSIRQVLQRRLHWVTLGGQYDWTNRVYPDAPPPRFPADVAAFLAALFPDTLAQAAIVNFYTPGDTMMMHRDVSEETDKGLVSLSFGCDCLFMIAPSRPGPGPGLAGGSAPEAGSEDVGNENDARGDGEAEKKYLLLRLRSGDAIYMTQESRYAWHGVPKVLKGTCPPYLADWPAAPGDGGRSEYEGWRGWMQSKRINLNVRQVKD